MNTAAKQPAVLAIEPALVAQSTLPSVEHLAAISDATRLTQQLSAHAATMPHASLPTPPAMFVCVYTLRFFTRTKWANEMGERNGRMKWGG